MINFIIPGLYEHKQLNMNLLLLIKEHPELFKENINISAIFGNFQFCTWDGGRNFTHYSQASKEEIENTQKLYNEIFKIPMRFVFTNNQLKEQDCYDRFNNLILHICDNPMNEIVISSPILYEYIKTEYPNYKFVSSTTKCLINPEDSIKEIQDEKYFMVCLDYNLNKNWTFLNSIPKQDRNKVEFLINAICPSGCQNRKEHYRLNSLYHLSYGKKYDIPTCGITSNTLNPELEKRNNLSVEEIFGKYIQSDFNNFKIEGRSLKTSEIAMNYGKYLAKPGYEMMVAQILITLTEK